MNVGVRMAQETGDEDVDICQSVSTQLVLTLLRLSGERHGYRSSLEGGSDQQPQNVPRAAPQSRATY